MSNPITISSKPKLPPRSLRIISIAKYIAKNPRIM